MGTSYHSSVFASLGYILRSGISETAKFKCLKQHVEVKEQNEDKKPPATLVKKEEKSAMVETKKGGNVITINFH